MTDESRFGAGNEVGDLAMGYFRDFVEVTAYKEDNQNLAKMIENTRAEIEKNTPVICEVSFDFGGLYCAVDILRRKDDGWSIYEVKSSTHEALEKEKSIKSNIHKLQIDHYLHDRGTYADKEHLRVFLGKLTYPLYMLKL